MRADASIHQLFEYLGSGTQDGDGAVEGSLILKFARFEDWDYNCLLPYCWQVGMLMRQVEEIC